jgi:hypothetical protein
MALKSSNKFRLVAAACLLSAFGWFVIAVFVLKESKHAGLGGEVAVAIALFTLFINEGFLESLKGPKASLEEGLTALGMNPAAGQPLTADHVRTGVATLFKKLVDASDDRRKENVFLAWATAVGVLVGAFGEIAAEWLLH